MKNGIWNWIRRRRAPVGLSLAAAAMTAVSFAAFSVAADEHSGRGSGADVAVPVPPPPGPRGIALRDDLSAAEREQLDQFRQCMEENGAPAPPRIDRGEGPPDPPSQGEMESLRKAFEACRSELPEELRREGFPPHPACGPPPEGDVEPSDRAGEGRNREQGFVIPAPAPSGA